MGCLRRTTPFVRCALQATYFDLAIDENHKMLKSKFADFEVRAKDGRGREGAAAAVRNSRATASSSANRPWTNSDRYASSS